MREPVVMQVAGVGQLIQVLAGEGYSVVGPTIRDSAIVYDTLTGVADLPVGWTDDQAPGMYRIRQRGDEALFGYVMGPHTWKRYLHPPETLVWEGRLTNGSFESIPLAEPPRYAFFGVRPCELAAIGIQDRVFMDGESPQAFVDENYRTRRDRAFLVAVNCVEPGEMCFCTSMDTGPRAFSGFDIALTEVIEAGGHYFLAEAGTDAGAEILAEVTDTRSATRAEQDGVVTLLQDSAVAMGRRLDIEGIKDVLYGNLEHPQWDDIADRCLSCTNCTMVCPTCFCATVEDGLSLDGTEATRTRRGTPASRSTSPTSTAVPCDVSPLPATASG